MAPSVKTGLDAKLPSHECEIRYDSSAISVNDKDMEESDYADQDLPGT